MFMGTRRIRLRDEPSSPESLHGTPTGFQAGRGLFLEKKMASPTSRTLELLRKEGYQAAVVEKFARNQRFDLFQAIDVLGVQGDVTLGVQTTTTDHAAERLTKIRQLIRGCYRDAKGKAYSGLGLREWVRGNGRRLEVWAWGKYRPKRGAKTYVYRVQKWSVDWKGNPSKIETQRDQ